MDTAKVRIPDWKNEYLKLHDEYCKALKDVENLRSIGLTILGELEKVTNKLMDERYEQACAKLDEDRRTQNERELEDLRAYVTYLESENKELKEQLQAAQWRNDCRTKYRKWNEGRRNG